MLYEIGRGDMSLALFFFLQNGVGIPVFDECANEE